MRAAGASEDDNFLPFEPAASSSFGLQNADLGQKNQEARLCQVRHAQTCEQGNVIFCAGRHWFPAA
jgi:hypothetical protein